MSKTLTQIFNETAEAIQQKTGNLEPISPENFGQEIVNIPGGGEAFNNYISFGTNYLEFHIDKFLEFLPEDIKNKVIIDSSGEDVKGHVWINLGTMCYNHDTQEVNSFHLSWYGGHVQFNWYQSIDVSYEQISPNELPANATVVDLLNKLIEKVGSNSVIMDFDFSGRGLTDYTLTVGPIFPDNSEYFTIDDLNQIFTKAEPPAEN